MNNGHCLIFVDHLCLHLRPSKFEMVIITAGINWLDIFTLSCLKNLLISWAYDSLLLEADYSFSVLFLWVE